MNVGSEIKAIAFNPDKTAKIDIPPDHLHKSVQISLPLGSTGEVLLPTCNNQEIIAADRSANCPVSPLSPTPLTLIDVSHQTNTQKGAFFAGAKGGIGGMGIAEAIMAIITPELAIFVPAAIAAEAGTGAAITAAGAGGITLGLAAEKSAR